jgi:DnaJ-class molecular chaperone
MMTILAVCPECAGWGRIAVNTSSISPAYRRCVRCNGTGKCWVVVYG